LQSLRVAQASFENLPESLVAHTASRSKLSADELCHGFKRKQARNRRKDCRRKSIQRMIAKPAQGRIVIRQNLQVNIQWFGSGIVARSGAASVLDLADKSDVSRNLTHVASCPRDVPMLFARSRYRQQQLIDRVGGCRTEESVRALT
jgi:hypothetical protein